MCVAKSSSACSKCLQLSCITPNVLIRVLVCVCVCLCVCACVCVEDCPKPPDPPPHAVMFLDFNRVKHYGSYNDFLSAEPVRARALVMHGSEYQLACVMRNKGRDLGIERKDSDGNPLHNRRQFTWGNERLTVRRQYHTHTHENSVNILRDFAWVVFCVQFSEKNALWAIGWALPLILCAKFLIPMCLFIEVRGCVCS